MRETCSSCSESSPDGELPAAFALAAAEGARRALPPRGRGVFVLSIAGDPARGAAVGRDLSPRSLVAVRGFETLAAEPSGLGFRGFVVVEAMDGEECEKEEE
uniref:Uncharacterized protein n=1 Tax=Arundo donax TaxID=35708 RepID=A0A0A9FPK2_ARUDO